jgi:hypothetical protein
MRINAYVENFFSHQKKEKLRGEHLKLRNPQILTATPSVTMLTWSRETCRTPMAKENPMATLLISNPEWTQMTKYPRLVKLG